MILFAELVVCCRYSYGPIEVNAVDGERLNLTAIPSYADTVVTGDQDGEPFSFRNEQWTIIELNGGSQSTITVSVLNGDSGVSIDYEVIFIRPLPSCSNAQLSQWYGHLSLKLLHTRV